MVKIFVARHPTEAHLVKGLLETEGIVAGNRGDLIRARAAHERALATAIELYPAPRQLQRQKRTSSF
jgi:hypothetical protein